MKEQVAFQAREFKGSRLRCLMATSLPKKAVAEFLSALVIPHAEVTTEDLWQPRGFLEPGEARVGDTGSFLSPEHCELVTGWWLRVRERANTPNWDIVSTCRFPSGERGLILVEAKAHADELHVAGKPSGNAANDDQIRSAVLEANQCLSGGLAGWALCVERNYQLCNRFAWSWKLATFGIPVVLVYLGFLGADEMGRGAFRTADDWQRHLLEHAQGTVPAQVWGNRVSVGQSFFVPLIRSAAVSAQVFAPPDSLGGEQLQ